MAKDPLARRLADEYALAFQSTGVNAREAAKMAREMVADAKRELKKSGALSEKANAGDLLLAEECRNTELRLRFDALRQDGVRDDDIRWWWNMHPLERAMIEKSDELSRMSALVSLLGQGVDPDSAARRVFSAHARFGDPRDGTGDDRPIAIELRRRITEFIERHYANPALMRQKTERASSFNALIRAEIRSGNI